MIRVPTGLRCGAIHGPQTLSTPVRISSNGRRTQTSRSHPDLPGPLDPRPAHQGGHGPKTTRVETHAVRKRMGQNSNGLELDLGDGAVGVGRLEVLRLREVEHAGDDVGRDLLDRRVELKDDIVVELSGVRDFLL